MLLEELLKATYLGMIRHYDALSLRFRLPELVQQYVSVITIAQATSNKSEVPQEVTMKLQSFAVTPEGNHIATDIFLLILAASFHCDNIHCRWSGLS